VGGTNERHTISKITQEGTSVWMKV